MTRHGITGAILATLILPSQAGAEIDGCDWAKGAFWNGAGLPDVGRCIAAGADIGARTGGGQLAADLAEDNEAMRNHDVFWTLNDARFD